MNVLETDRVVIRPTRPEEVDDVIALWTDPEVMRYMGGPSDPEKLRAVVRDLLKRPAAARAKAYGIWCVVSKDDGTHLGDAGLIEKEVDGVAEVEVIYILRPEHWGQGLGTEIATALVAHAFGPRDRARVVALIHPDNAASARVAEKAGLSFDRETVRRGGKTLRVYVRHRTRD